MKFKRFMFKVLRLKVLIPIILVIVAGALLIAYFFGGVKSSVISTDSNLEFNYEDFTRYDLEENSKDIDYDTANVLAGVNRKWLAQNDKYVLYFDYATTVAYVYQITPESIGAAKQPGTNYPLIDITKCPIVYQTAKDSVTASDGANFVVSYADSSTGNAVTTEFNTMTNAVFYSNPLTGEIEHHYALKEVEDGIQVFYTVGEFSAGNSYFSKQIYQTMYKPYNGPDPDGELKEKSYAGDEEAYNTAMTYWVKYMEMLGVKDPLEASDYEINIALTQTYEQRYRGNALLKMKEVSTKPSEGTITWAYTGTVTVYTEEAYKDMVNFKNQGLIDYEEVTLSFEGAATSSKYFKYGNAAWKFTNVSSNFFTEGEGKFFNTKEGHIFINTAIPSKYFESELGYGNTGNAYTVQSDNDHDFRYYLRKDMKPFTKVSVFGMLYKSDTEWEHSISHYKYIDEDGNPYVGGGILKVDEDGYVFDDSGKIEKTIFNIEQAATDNAMFDIETQTVLAVFGFACEFKLTDEGLTTTILSESLIDYSNVKEKDIAVHIAGEEMKLSEINTKYELLNITILPQMTTTKSPVNYTYAEDGEDGYILIPDGSGAIINFGNGKYELSYEGVNKVYYGSDNAFSTKAKPEDTKDLMLGMFGYVISTPTRAHGLIGVIESGGSQNTLLANTDQYKNYAYFKLCVRRNQEVKIGTGSGARPFYKLAKNLADLDCKYLYMFLDEDELDYSTIAKRYQEHLIKRDFDESETIEDVKKDTTRDTVVDLNFLGSFEKYSLLLGFKYKTADSLTTFDQAKEIIEELTDGVEVDGVKQNINEYNVSFTGWTNEELEYDLGGRLVVNSVLGGLSSMRDFANFLNSNGKTLYIETKITTTTNYDYAFGKLKFNARNVANDVATVYDYDAATLRQSKKLLVTNYINPIYFINITNYVISKMERINKNLDEHTGYYLDDLGNNTTNSYRSYDEVYGEKTIQYQLEALKKLSETGKVKVEAPYDYAFKYVDFATNVPMTSTLAPIYDETIPFYQLVISGLFDYTTEDINGTSNNSARWFYAKALETGSNLSFVISAENPNILLDTDYTYYYQAYYQNWKETIVNFATKIDESKIHQGYLVYHESIGRNISFVQYKLYNGGGYINLCVNTTESDFTVDTDLVINGVTIPQGTVVPGYGYYKIG